MPQPRLSTLSTIVAVVVSAEIRSIPAQSGWIQAAPPVSMTPRGFTGPTSDFLRNRTVVFGGWSGATVLGDTWEWDGATWSQATPVNSPPPRCCSYVAYDYGRARVVLFGGAVGTGASTDVNDTWEWDGTNWTSVTPLNSPQARRGGTLVYDPINAAVLLFGGGVGSSGSPILSDTWTFDGVTWTQQTPSNVPPARWQGMVATDWSNGTVVMFGGAASAPW